MGDQSHTLSASNKKERKENKEKKKYRRWDSTSGPQAEILTYNKYKTMCCSRDLKSASLDQSNIYT